MNFSLRALTLGLSLALCLLVGFAAPSSYADGDPQRERHVKIVACEGGDVAEINADELALGETRDIGASCGKVVTVTRTPEDEIRVAVDGEVIDAPGEDGEDGTVRRKIVLRTHDEDCNDAEDCHDNVRVRKVIVRADAGEDVDVMALISDSLLEDCEEGDEECRAEVLRLLEEQVGEDEIEPGGDGEHVVVIKKRVRSGDDHDADQEH